MVATTSGEVSSASGASKSPPSERGQVSIKPDEQYRMSSAVKFYKNRVIQTLKDGFVHDQNELT